MNYLLSNSPTLSTSFTYSTPSTKVILVRHARTTYNEQGRYQGSSDESVLTEKGHQDAYSTGLALQKYNFDAIYTSPLTRVQQTTQAILAAFKQTNNLPPVFIDHKLTEIQMSDWQGLFYQEVKEKFSEAYSCWQETPHLFTFNNIFFPVLELFKQAQQFWQVVLNKHRGQTILVVAHGGTNRALISTAVGLNPKHYHSLQQSNCGISCLEFSSEDKFGELKYLNVTNHLGETLPKLKAGKTGWRWILLSNAIAEGVAAPIASAYATSVIAEGYLSPAKCERSLLAENISSYSYVSKLINHNLIDLLLTDNLPKSELLANNLLVNNNKILHLPMAQNNFLDSWQQTIFTRQRLKNNLESASLVTGLIIASDKLITQILHKTLTINTPLNTANHSAIIHYPYTNNKSILQGILPLKY
jgi:phosphoserine phosphatase